jgi:O-antigen ligase
MFAMSRFKNNFVTGVAVGLAAGVIIPMLIPAIKRSNLPLAKSLVKGSAFLSEKGRKAVAGAGKIVGDFVAEVRAEAMERQGAFMVDVPAGYAMAVDSEPQAYSGSGSRGTGDDASAVQIERAGPT